MTRVFVSFDYDHDVFLKEALVGQSRLPDSPFTIADWSIKEPSPDWRVHARRRIRASDVVTVICGEHTQSAVGVATELAIAREEGIPYFLLHGYSDRVAQKPTTALSSEKVYKWTWENLKILIRGGR